MRSPRAATDVYASCRNFGAARARAQQKYTKSHLFQHTLGLRPSASKRARLLLLFSVNRACGHNQRHYNNTRAALWQGTRMGRCLNKKVMHSYASVFGHGGGAAPSVHPSTQPVRLRPPPPFSFDGLPWDETQPRRFACAI